MAAPRASGATIALFLTVAFVAPAAAKTTPEQRACKKSCKTVFGVCAKAAASEKATSRTACGEATATPQCRRDVKRIFKAARRVCRSARKRCRACCKASGSGCDVTPELPRFSGEFPAPDRAALNQPPLPPGPGGRGFMLLDLPDGAFFFDPAARSPVSAAAECATVVLACFEPTLRNWAGCFASVPVCETDTPWVGDHPMCCPAECGERFQELRAAGRSDPAAFAAAIWEAPSCMPSLEGHVREVSP